MYISMNFIVKIQKIQKNQKSIVTRVLAIFLVVMPQLQHWEPFCPCSLMPQVMLIKSMCHNDILLSIHPRRKQLKKKMKKNCNSVSPHFNGFFGLFFAKRMFFWATAIMKLVLMQAHHIPLTINILKYTKLDEQIGRSVSMYAENFFPSLLTLRRMQVYQYASMHECQYANM